MSHADALTKNVSVAEKLHWAFKLYDKDGNGEIDQEEMEEIFVKLCMLVIEKEDEETAKVEDTITSADLMLAARIQQQQETSNMQLISQKLQTRKKLKEMKNRRKQKVRKSKSATNLHSSDTEDDVLSSNGSDWSRSSRSGRCSLDSTVSLECPSLSLAWEMRDPDRDCANFNPQERARELFEALDVDGDGVVTEDEFISGCMKDEVFIMLLQKFSGEEVWGIQ